MGREVETELMPPEWWEGLFVDFEAGRVGQADPVEVDDRPELEAEEDEYEAHYLARMAWEGFGDADEYDERWE